MPKKRRYTGEQIIIYVVSPIVIAALVVQIFFRIIS